MNHFDDQAQTVRSDPSSVHARPDSQVTPGWRTKPFPEPAVTPSCGWPKDVALPGEPWLWSGSCEVLGRTVFLVRPLSLCLAVQ